MPHQFPTFEAKRAHEREVAEKLTSLKYPDVVFERFGNDHGEPDVLFQDRHTVLGVEVTTAYWEDSEFVAEDRVQHDNFFCEVITKRVLVKATRVYENADEIVLCIEARDPGSGEFSILDCLLNIPIPHQHPFHAIYVLSYSGAGSEYEVFTLFPLIN